MKNKKLRVLKNFIKESIEKLSIDKKLREVISFLEKSLEDNLDKEYNFDNMFYWIRDLSYIPSNENNRTRKRLNKKTREAIEEIFIILEIEEEEFDLTEIEIEKFRKKVGEILNKLIDIIVNELHIRLNYQDDDFELIKHQIIIDSAERIINAYRFNLVQDYVGKKRVESYIEEENPAKKIVDALSKEGKVSKDKVNALIELAKEEYESNIDSGDSHIEAMHKLEEYLKLFYEFTEDDD